MNHPVLTAIAAIHAAFDEVAGVDPVFMSVAEKKTALVEMARLRARADALDLRLLAAGSVDVAEDTGARSTATWVAEATGEAHGTLRHRAVVAKALDSTWRALAAALSAGQVNLAQTRAILESLDALDALPGDLPEGSVGKAEEFLIEKAAEPAGGFGPRELRALGRGVLQHLAPDIAEAVELKRLELEEDRAAAVTRLSFRRRGDGTTDVYARLADHAAHRLRTYADAIANPRRPENLQADDYPALPVDRRRGIAFQSLLETVLERDLPQHGQSATSVVVTITHQALVTGLGAATTSTGQTITAAQARRLACQAGILPAVLDANSEILDVGHTQRFFTGPLRKALDLRDQECTTRGCHVPAAFCHGHHWRQPWAQGGRTSLANGKLLCPFHHHRAHHPTWDTHHHPDGTTTFTRRQ